MASDKDSKTKKAEPKGSTNQTKPNLIRSIPKQSDREDDSGNYDSDQQLPDSDLDSEEDQDEGDGEEGEDETEDDPPELDELVKRFCPTLDKDLVSLVVQEPGQTHATALSILSTFFELECQRDELNKVEQEVEQAALEEEEEDDDDDDDNDDEDDDGDEDSEEEEEEEGPEDSQDLVKTRVEVKENSLSSPISRQQHQHSSPIKAQAKALVTLDDASASPDRSPAAAAAANAALARFGKGPSKSPLSTPPHSASQVETLKKASAPPKTLAELGLARPSSLQHASSPAQTPQKKPVAARTGPGGRRIAKGGKKPPPPSSSSSPGPRSSSSPSDQFGKSNQSSKPQTGGIHTIFGSSNSTSSGPSPQSRLSPSSTLAAESPRSFSSSGIGQKFGDGPQLEYDAQTELALKLKAAGRTAEQIERAMRAARSAEIRARGLSPAEQAIAEREARRLDADTLEKVLSGHIVAPQPVQVVKKKKKKAKGNKKEASMPGGSQLAMFARRLAKTPLSVRAQAVATAIAAASRWKAKSEELDEEEALKAAAARAKAKREKEETERRKLQGNQEAEKIPERLDHVVLPADYDEQKVLNEAIRVSRGLSPEEEWQAAADKKQKEKEKTEAASARPPSASPATTEPSASKTKKKKKKKSSAPVASPPTVQASGRGASAISQRSLDALAAARSVQVGEVSPPPLPAQLPVGITVPAAHFSASLPISRGGDLPLLHPDSSQSFISAESGLSSDWDEYEALRYLKGAFPSYKYEELEKYFDEANGDLGVVVDRLAEEDKAREIEEQKLHFASLGEEDARVPSKAPLKATPSLFQSTANKAAGFFRGVGEVLRLPGAGGKDRASTVSTLEVIAAETAALIRSSKKLRDTEFLYKSNRQEALRQVTKAYQRGGPNSRNQMEEFKAEANSWGRRAIIYGNAAAELEVEERRRKAARRRLGRTFVPVVGARQRPITKEDLPPEIDLHRLTVREAQYITQKYIESWDFDGEPKITIITGAGHHSTEGIAKIKPAINRWLEDNSLTYGIRVVGEGNGWYVVSKW